MRYWVWRWAERAVSFRVVRKGLSDKETFQRGLKKSGEGVQQIFRRRVLKVKGTLCDHVLGPNQGSSSGWVERGRTRTVGSAESVSRTAGRPRREFGFILCGLRSLWSMFCRKALFFVPFVYAFNISKCFKRQMLSDADIAMWIIWFTMSVIRGTWDNLRAPWR